MTAKKYAAPSFGQKFHNVFGAVTALHDAVIVPVMVVGDVNNALVKLPSSDVILFDVLGFPQYES